MSLDWDALDRHIQKAEHAEVTGLLLAATEQERLACAPRVESRIKATRTDDWWTPGADPSGGYALAVIGCMPSPARAAALLCRRDLRERWHSVPANGFLRIARERELPWLGELAVRLADGLVTRDGWSEGWSFVSTVLRAAGATPPATEAVVRGWLRELNEFRDHDRPIRYVDRMREHPFLDVLLPSVFDIDGLGGEMNTGYHRTDTGWHSAPLFPAAVAQLVAEGRLDRGQILAATVDRLVRGDRPHHLRTFVLLHDALAPTVDELAEYASDYARLLPDAPSTVAALAQRALRAVGDAGRLELDTLLEASRPTLLRKEKNVVKAQLTLLDRAARREPERAGEVLETVAEAFGHPALDIQERALTLVDRRSAGISADTRARLAGAATALGADLRARAAATLGSTTPEPRLAADPAASAGAAVGPAGAGPAGVGPAGVGLEGAGLVVGPAGVGPAALVGPAAVAAPLAVVIPAPAAMPPPIGDAAELAEEVVALLHEQSAVRWERVLAGLVSRRAAGETAQLAAALEPVLDRHPNHFADHDWGYWQRIGLLGDAIRAVIAPDRHGAGLLRMISGVRAAHQGGDSSLAATPDGILSLRIAEITVQVARAPVPMLVATPTHVNGALPAEVLLRRLQAAEAQGWQPWRLDLEQALLRVPRDRDAEVTRRAEALTTPAGREFAEWLTAGGLPDPVSTRFEQRAGATGFSGYRAQPVARRVVANLEPVRDGGLHLEKRLVPLVHRSRTDYYREDLVPDVDVLAMALPHHREVVAARALLGFAALAEEEGLAGASSFPQLAEASGPIGPAMTLALAYLCGARHRADRAAAVDAFLILAARDEPFAAALGADLGDLCGDGTVKLNRVVLALADAHAAGASGAVWEVLAAALPLLLPKAPRGLPDLLELASRVAAETGVRAEIERLAEVAGRPGSTRLVKEARRLRSVLLT
ncbi:DUF6493 family protein [Actinoplanes sp. NPDC049668]|uniref:DUF6493 family protein n=1 Tax=unclassified Actinoplanes TaxID=2626549 RepID=UPI0033B3E430